MTHVRPEAQPTLERSWLRPAVKRCTFPPRRLARAVRRHTARAVEEGEIGVVLLQDGQQIGERREYREADAPAITVLRSE